MATLPLKIKTGSMLIYVVCTALAVAVGVLYPRWRRYTRIRAFKHQHGCKDAAKYPHEDPIMGSDMTRARLKAMQKGRFFRLYTEQFQKYGKTFEEIWRGKPLINTTEPANLQRIAAVGFDDFGKVNPIFILTSKITPESRVVSGVVRKLPRQLNDFGVFSQILSLECANSLTGPR
jgi:hypothetical protein